MLLKKTNLKSVLRSIEMNNNFSLGLPNSVTYNSESKTICFHTTYGYGVMRGFNSIIFKLKKSKQRGYQLLSDHEKIASKEHRNSFLNQLKSLLDDVNDLSLFISTEHLKNIDTQLKTIGERVFALRRMLCEYDSSRKQLSHDKYFGVVHTFNSLEPRNSDRANRINYDTNFNTK